MADLNIRKDQTVQTADGRQGIVRYIGDLHVPGVWLGLELPDSTGKNDGSVKGTAYFSCPPGHGIFVRKEAVVKILRQPAPAANFAPTQRSNSVTPTVNGASARPRPSGVMPADIARKRQSLMSAGSGSTTASRLSVRVRQILFKITSFTNSCGCSLQPSLLPKLSPLRARLLLPHELALQQLPPGSLIRARSRG